MLRRFTSGLLTAVLFGTLFGGAALGRGRGESCPMRGMRGKHSCCKRAPSKRRTSAVTAARTCCIVNCPRPAPTEPRFSFRTSSDASTSPKPAAAAQTPNLQPPSRPRAYSPPFHPSHSPPAYIQHAAFLI